LGPGLIFAGLCHETNLEDKHLGRHRLRLESNLFGLLISEEERNFFVRPGAFSIKLFMAVIVAVS